MKQATKLLFGVLLTVGLADSLWAQGFQQRQLLDTAANRSRETVRYLQIIPASEIIGDVTQNIAQTLPLEQQKDFITNMRSEINLNTVHENISKAMVKHMNATEIGALADFYSTPVGKSAMKKMGLCMSEVTPLVQKEIQSAMQRLQKKGLVIFKTAPSPKGNTAPRR